MRTRYEVPVYALGVMPGTPDRPKSDIQDEVCRRVMGHLRAAMTANGLGLNATATRLGEDKGALSVMLHGKRIVNLYVAYRIQVVFDIKAHDLLNVDPDPEFMRPYVPEPQKKRYALRDTGGDRTPSVASRVAARPGKRKRQMGGGQ